MESLCMSIMVRSNPHPSYGNGSLYVYPKWNGELRPLASYVAYGDLAEVAMVSYDSRNSNDELPFRSLWRTVKEKYLNVDHILDDILSDEPA